MLLSSLTLYYEHVKKALMDATCPLLVCMHEIAARYISPKHLATKAIRSLMTSSALPCPFHSPAVWAWRRKILRDDARYILIRREIFLGI